MIHAILALLLCQLAGEAVTSAFALPLPGPVLGMALLTAGLLIRPDLAETVRPAASGLLQHLSLLFVPAGVGVVGQIAVLGSEAASLLLAVVASTVIGMAAAAWTFVLVARIAGVRDE